MAFRSANFVLTGLILLTLSSPVAAQTPVPPLLQGVTRIVTLGDSITQGGGRPGGYVWLLDRYLDAVYPSAPVEIVNAGISGHKATDMQARFERDVLAARPQLVTISVGVNDVWHAFRDFKTRTDYPDGRLPNGVPLPLYVEKVEAMIVAAKAAGIRVVLLTPTPIHEDPASPENARLAGYVKALTALGAKHQATVVDLNTAMTRAIAAHQREAGRRVNVLTTDGVHLNPAGNQLVAWTILRGLGVPDAALAAARPETVPPPSGPRLKVLLDTDIGTDIDDAWALGLLLVSPRVELVGVTISDGDTAARAKVAAKLLHAAGRGEVPVAVGRATPPPDSVDYQFTWAEDFTAVQPVATPAADFIVETLRRQPGEITLVAVGPLQNLADALRKEPSLGRLAKRIVLMSGSIGPNAWSSAAVAEWNVKRAIADAQLVYSSVPLTIVPLDSTTYVTLHGDERTRLERHPAPLTRALEALYRLWIGSPDQRMTLHDQMAIGETLRPGEFFGRCETMPIGVDERGFTLVDQAAGKPVSVCLEPKRDPFMTFYIDGLLQAK
jgi:inosine-uridine nucleoside N-ribohydrolase/lysophospholipase L1-like esterase